MISIALFEGNFILLKFAQGKDLKTMKYYDTIYFDIDDTLVLWDNLRDLKNLVTFIDPYSKNKKYPKKIRLTPHQEHIQELIKWKEQGYTVVVWSLGGQPWAQEVVNKLELNKYVDYVLSKPHKYYDDVDVNNFMGAENNLHKVKKIVD